MRLALAQVYRCRNGFVETFDGVVKQLDDVFAAVGELTRIFLGYLVVVGSLGQTRRPNVVLVRVNSLALSLPRRLHQ